METNKATSASSFTGEEMEFGEVQVYSRPHSEWLRKLKSSL